LSSRVRTIVSVCSSEMFSVREISCAELSTESLILSLRVVGQFAYGAGDARYGSAGVELPRAHMLPIRPTKQHAD